MRKIFIPALVIISLFVAAGAIATIWSDYPAETSLATNDTILILDVSDTTLDATGSQNYMTIANFVTGIESMIDAITSSGDFSVTLGDADGANKMAIKDSGSSEVASIDSNGVGSFSSIETTGSSSPGATFMDSDAAGTQDADHEAAKIAVNMETTTEDGEDGKMELQVMRNGSETTYLYGDGNTNVSQWGDATFRPQRLGVSAGATDGMYDGDIRTFTVDSGVSDTSFGQAYHVDTDGQLIAADADGTSTMPAIGLAVETGTGSKKVLTRGLICETDWNWTVGGLVYVSTDPATTEGLSQTAVSGTGDQSQVVGIALTADCIEVNMGGYVLVEVP